MKRIALACVSFYVFCISFGLMHVTNHAAHFPGSGLIALAGALLLIAIRWC